MSDKRFSMNNFSPTIGYTKEVNNANVFFFDNSLKTAENLEKSFN